MPQANCEICVNLIKLEKCIIALKASSQYIIFRSELHLITNLFNIVKITLDLAIKGAYFHIIFALWFIMYFSQIPFYNN